MTAQGAGADWRASDDATLVRRSLEGAAEASEALVRRFERPVFNLIARLVRDPTTAEDLTQDTFLKVFRALATFDPRYRLSSWIFRIAHNTAIDFLRQRRLLVASPPPDADGDDQDPVEALPDLRRPSPEQIVLRDEQVATVDRALDELRPEYRAALVLRYQEGLEYQEIAEVMALPLGTVKTYLHRARRELARRLTSDGGETRP